MVVQREQDIGDDVNRVAKVIRESQINRGVGRVGFSRQVLDE